MDIFPQNGYNAIRMILNILNKGGLSMKAVSRWLDRFCYDHPNFGIPNLMKYIVIGNVMVYFLDLFSRGYASLMLSFSSPLILQGDRKSVV